MDFKGSAFGQIVCWLYNSAQSRHIGKTVIYLKCKFCDIYERADRHEKTLDCDYSGLHHRNGK